MLSVSGGATSALSRALIPPVPFDPANAVAMMCGPEVMMRFTALELQKRGLSPERIYARIERNMKCAIGFCGHCQFGPTFICKDGPVFRYDRMKPLSVSGSCEMKKRRKPKLAVWKFASCDGCQLSLLDCEDELLALWPRNRDCQFRRSFARRRQGPLRFVAGRRFYHDRARCGAHPRSAPCLEMSGHDRRLRDGRRHPGAAQFRRRKGIHLRSCTRVPTTSQTLATSTPIADACRGRFRTARLPDQQATIA